MITWQFPLLCLVDGLVQAWCWRWREVFEVHTLYRLSLILASNLVVLNNFLNRAAFRSSQLAHTARKQSTSLVNKIANRPKKLIIKISSDRAEEEPNKQGLEARTESSPEGQILYWSKQQQAAQHQVGWPWVVKQWWANVLHHTQLKLCLPCWKGWKNSLLLCSFVGSNQLSTSNQFSALSTLKLYTHS